MLRKRELQVSLMKVTRFKTYIRYKVVLFVPWTTALNRSQAMLKVVTERVSIVYEILHKMFRKYHISARQYLGNKFSLLKRLNMEVAAIQLTISFCLPASF
jgi:hypothetical protein